MRAVTVLDSNTQQGSDAWLVARMSGIGGSEVAAVLGLNPWQTPVDVWKTKTGRDQRQETSEVMEWGHRLEPVVAAAYGAEHPEAELAVPPPLLRHPNYGHALASLDRLAHYPGETVAVEVKTTRAWFDTVPVHVLAQVQWQMAVTGLGRAHIAVLNSGSRYREHAIEADPAWAAEALDYTRHWWRQHVENDRMPDPDPTRDDLGQLWQPDPAASVEVPPDLWADFQAASVRASAAKNDQDELRGRIQILMGEATRLTLHGETVATWSAVKPRTSVDGKRLAAEHPDVFAQVAKTGQPSRMFRTR